MYKDLEYVLKKAPNKTYLIDLKYRGEGKKESGITYLKKILNYWVHSNIM